MSTITRWVIPCRFTNETRTNQPIEFDLTSYLKLMLDNNVWDRKFSYGSNFGLKATNSADIKRSSVKIYPIFFSGELKNDRIIKIIEIECGKLPNQLKNCNLKAWHKDEGCAIVETEFFSETNYVNSKKYQKEITLDQQVEVINNCEKFKAVSVELASFLLATLNLSFPTQAIVMRDEDLFYDGFLQIISCNEVNYSRFPSNAFTHKIKIELDKISNVEVNMAALSSIWHYALWPLKRYLFAVESAQVSIDNLLDLIYALEGLFDKNTSTDYIKMMCIALICKNKREADSMRSFLKLAFRIRNDIVHGGQFYDTFDTVELEGKPTIVQTIYWRMKSIVAEMIIKSISKLINDKNLKNLKFNDEDFFRVLFRY